jgi:hypothetical protein
MTAGPRLLGSVTCRGCGRQVSVQYAYSNSDRCIMIADHADEKMRLPDDPPGHYPRCTSAGWLLIDGGRWLKYAGYTPDEVLWDVSIAFERAL